jgi:hypothetical protein
VILSVLTGLFRHARCLSLGFGGLQWNIIPLQP